MSANDLHCVLLCQFALCSQVGKELTTWDVGHQEVQIARVLREALQADLKFFIYYSVCILICYRPLK